MTEPRSAEGSWRLAVDSLLDATVLPPTGATLVVGVSGGADSCALWDLLVLAGRWPLVVWHLDHGLRPESTADAEFVRQRGFDYGQAGGVVLTEGIDLRNQARAWRCGLEAAGRRHRHARLAEVARQHHATAVATAHHQDDQAETVLMNLLRGAGDAGLAGIPPRRRLAAGIDLVRPLLNTARVGLRAHLQARGLDWREDASNADPRFTRNRLRNAVLPVLEGGLPGVSAELAAAALAAQQRLTVARAQAAKLWDGKATRLPLITLLITPTSVRAELWLRLLRAQGCPLRRSHVQRLDALITAAPDTRLHVGGTTFVRETTTLAWFTAASAPPAEVDILFPGVAWLPGGILSLTEVPVPGDPRVESGVILDGAAVRPPLVWRQIRLGERWTPLGSPGSQPLADTLAARRVPAWQRPSIMVLADAAGPLWIPAVGLIAERAKISPETQTALAVTLLANEEQSTG